jgi:hypothetical protein
MKNKNMKNKNFSAPKRCENLFEASACRTRRGEVTTQQIVLLIILLVSFAVILFLIFRLDFGKESDSEVCHNSVVMKGSSVVPADATPLKCSRTYICITKDGRCESMTKPDIRKVATKEEVFNVLAEEMANCWWMFGEGKVDYVGKDNLYESNYCSICSQIAFDNSLVEVKNEKDASIFSNGEISKDELYNYLSITPIPDKDMNYAEYLFGTNDINELKTQILIKEENGNKRTPTSFGIISLDKQQFVLTGITSEVGIGWRVAAGIGAVVVGFYIPGPGWTLAGSVLGTLIFEYGDDVGAIIVKGDGIKNSFMAPTIQEANSDSLKNLNCYEVITSA